MQTGKSRSEMLQPKNKNKNVYMFVNRGRSEPAKREEGGGGSFSVSLKREWGKGDNASEGTSSREPESMQSIPTDSYRLQRVHVDLGEMQKIQLCMQDLFAEFPSTASDTARMEDQHTHAWRRKKNKKTKSQKKRKAIDSPRDVSDNHRSP